MKILIADDEEINRILIQEFLANIGYHCLVAENGVQVLEILKTEKVDLIFMDIRMPEKNGLETTIAIKSDPNISSKPSIIALTANSNVDERNECMKAGMDDFLPKPFRLKDLKGMLEKWGNPSFG